jgi:hypothetical protein
MGADVELILIPGRDLGKVKMDSSQMNKILANLVMNSSFPKVEHQRCFCKNSKLVTSGDTSTMRWLMSFLGT